MNKDTSDLSQDCELKDLLLGLSNRNTPEHSYHPHWHRHEGKWYLRGAARHFKGDKVSVSSKFRGTVVIDLTEFEEVCRYVAQEPKRHNQIQPFMFSAIMLRRRKQHV